MTEENEGQPKSSENDEPETSSPPPPPDNVQSTREAGGATSEPSEDGSATKTGSDGKDE